MSAASARLAPSGLLAGARRRFAASSSAPVYVALGAMMVVSFVLIGPRFLGYDNVLSILQRSVALGLVAAGQTLAILVGSLDLSVAYVVSVTAVLASVVMQGNPEMMIPAVIVVLAVGGLIGLTNGLIITKLGVNAFIATLGMALVLRGLLNATFDNFAGSVPREFQVLGYGNVGPVPYSVLLLGVVVAAVWFLLRHTRFGHHVYAVGGSEETARLSGVRSHRVIISAHVLCSVAAALAGLFIVSRLGAGAPWVGPDGGYDLESIAAVVVGGTALAGGRGGVFGTLAGVFILATLDNVFNLLQVDPFIKDTIRGIILISAVAVYALRLRGSR
jgi:ribose transport system permease protein